MEKEKPEKAEKKYFINIEGKEYPWNNEAITVREMRMLANLPRERAMVEEFPDGREKTLLDGEIVVLRPGHRYGRAPKFKRG